MRVDGGWRVVGLHLVTTSIQHLAGSSGSIGFAWMWCRSQHLSLKLVSWCFTALSAQIGYIMTYK